MTRPKALAQQRRRAGQKFLLGSVVDFADLGGAFVNAVSQIWFGGCTASD